VDGRSVVFRRGGTNRQIAAELYISDKTASVHVSNILRKLEVSTGQRVSRCSAGTPSPSTRVKVNSS